MRAQYSSLFILALLMALAASAIADDSNQSTDAGSILRQEEALQTPAPAPLPEIEIEAPLPELTGIGDVTVDVREVRFTGAIDLVGDAALNEVVAEAIGRDLDFEGLQALAERVTRHLKDEGWILARAYLPEQDVSDGVITIDIIPGRLDTQGRAFRIEDIGEQPLRIDPERLGDMLIALIPEGEPVREADLNRAILLINDLPGIDALARLEAGEATGSTHILLSVREGDLFSASANASNFGSRSTGQTRGGVNAALSGPFGIGDQATFGYTRSEGLDLAQLGYSRPLGASGLRLDLAHTNLRYKVIDGPGEDDDLKGDAWTNRAGVEFPVIRTQLTNLSVGFDWTYEALEDRIAGDKLSDKRVEFYSPSASFDHTDQLFGWVGRTDLSLTPRWGELDLSRVESDLDADAAEFQADGHYKKAEYRVSRLQGVADLPLTLFAELRGQWAGDNLDSSQRFQVGGPNGLRAYPSGEASSDEGHLLRAEARYALPGDLTELGQMTLSAFYDHAWVQRHHDLRDQVIDSATGKNSYEIKGAGLSLSLVPNDRVSFSLTWAATIGDNPGRDTNGNDSDGYDDDHRAWLQAVFRL
jgi:hemolysin activation/secretion protein